MKISIISILILLLTIYTSNIRAQSPTISTITNIYRNVSQLVTVTGAGFTVGTNLTLKNSFNFYGVSLNCPSTVFINSTQMTCVVPNLWASDYTQVVLNNTYTSRYLTIISAKISFINITYDGGILVTGDGFLPNSTFELQSANNSKVQLSCYNVTEYKIFSCQVPSFELLYECFKLNYADSYYSSSINYYLAPTFISVELLGNALKLEVDGHCPSNSPSYTLNINSIPFSSIVKADPYLYFEPSFDLCTQYSKNFNMSLTSSFYSYGTVKFQSNSLLFNCEKGKASINDNSQDLSDSSNSTKLLNLINFSTILIVLFIYLI